MGGAGDRLEMKPALGSRSCRYKVSGWWKQQRLIFSPFWTSGPGVSTGPTPFEGLQERVCPRPLSLTYRCPSSHFVSFHGLPSVCTRDLISSSYKDASHIGLGPTRRPCLISSPLKGPYLQIQSRSKVPQHMNSQGDTGQPTHC